MGILLLAVISVLIQLLGVLTPIIKYFVEMSSVSQMMPTGALVWNAKYSILGWSVKWLLFGGELEIAAVRLGMKFWLVWGTVCLIGIGSVLFVSGKRRKLVSFGLEILGLGMGLVLLFVCRSDPAYYSERMDLANVQNVLEEQYRADDVVFIQSYGSPAWHYWMNWSDPRVHWISLPYSFPEPSEIDRFMETQNPEDALDVITLDLLEQEIQQTRRVWLVVPSDSPGAGLGLEASWLKARANTHTDWRFDSGLNETRLYLFDIE